jgi:uncharacterized protein (DUF305 family)
MDGLMARMHVAMPVVPSGDPDRERLRRLAQGIIVEQGQEIEVVRSILKQEP